jgi:DNA adenine methylase
MKIMKSPIKWAGGKRKMVDLISPYYEQYRDKRWVDLFCGGCSLPLAIKPDRVLANDLNRALIGYFKCLQEGENIETSWMRRDPDLYQRMVDKYPIGDQIPPDVFHYFNRAGFNGLFRVNSKGIYNIPIGGGKTEPNFNIETGYTEIFESWEFTNNDWMDVQINDDDDFLYIDPPYDGGFVGYTAGGFSWKDQIALCQYLTDDVTAPVVLQNAATDRIVELYGDMGWDLIFVDAQRNIQPLANRTAKEIIATIRIEK